MSDLESSRQDRMKRIVRMIGLIIADILTVVLSSLLAGWIRQDFNIDVYLSDYGPDLLKTVPFFALGLILIPFRSIFIKACGNTRALTNCSTSAMLS